MIQVEAPLHDVVVVRSISSATGDNLDNNHDQAVADADLQTPETQESASEIVQPVDPTSREPSLAFEAYSTPQSNQQDNPDKTGREKRLSGEFNQTINASPDLQVHESQKEGQDLAATVHNSKVQHTQAQKSANSASCGASKSDIVTEAARVVAGPASTMMSPQSSCASPGPVAPSLARLPLSKTPQDRTLMELKEQRAALLHSLANLPAIQVLVEESDYIEAEADNAHNGPTEADVMAAANKIVREHIKLLHEYNELKDVGQGLMGLIADQRGVRIVEVQEEFGIEAKD